VISIRHAAGFAASLSLLVPAAAHAAGDPIMPLASVQSGMHCTGYSVIRGTAITSFDVDVIDVLAGPDASILVKVSGPAVDETGIAEGFSGSPVKCPDPADGNLLKTIGAIAQGTGDYGNKLVLVTPIQTMLGEAVVPPVGAKPMSKALKRKVRALATPLSFSGVSGPVATALSTAGKKLGRALYAAPATPRASAFPVQTLQPGSSVAVGLAGGDIEAGAVGTVTYVDGNDVWAFGHPLDGAGRRSLLLQDAYVYTVVNNPIDTESVTSYKLAAPGHDLGTLSNDAPSAVIGALGALPERFPLRVTGTDLDSGRVIHLNAEVADETTIGQPTGTSSLTQVGPVAVAQAAYDVLRGSPARQSGEMCVRIGLRERKAPLRVCNTYVGGSPTSPGAPMAADFASATALIDAYKFSALHVTGVSVNLKLRRALRQAYILDATAPSAARRGSDLKVKVSARRVRGAAFTRTVKVHIPRYLSAGTHVLTLTGAPADAVAGEGDAQDLSSLFTVTLGDDSDSGEDDPGPRTLAELAQSFDYLEREDGVTASFRDVGDANGDTASAEIEVLRDPQLRISGSAKLRVRVRP
jgi:phosphoglycolate phosphatase-like HAD superfamily hydrolase